MHDRDRRPTDVLYEHVGYLALLAVREHYRIAPELWTRGEFGREKCRTDYEHHFRVLASLDVVRWTQHKTYMQRVFSSRDLPAELLEDAWRIMEAMCQLHLVHSVWEEVRPILRPPTATD